MDKIDVSLLPSDHCTEPDDSPPLLEDYFSLNFDSYPDMTWKGDPQISLKWMLDDPQIVDKVPAGYLIVSVNLPPMNCLTCCP